jgi:hypothetical protein
MRAAGCSADGYDLGAFYKEMKITITGRRGLFQPVQVRMFGKSRHPTATAPQGARFVFQYPEILGPFYQTIADSERTYLERTRQLFHSRESD